MWSLKALQSANLIEFGAPDARALGAQQAPGRADVSTLKINEWYSCALKNGAVGGKLIGAGGGAFLIFVRHAMIKAGVREIRFRFDFERTKVIAQ
jgi:D-glycero-alpha-D-manno-heptose-7-phosphate kinase